MVDPKLVQAAYMATEVAAQGSRVSFLAYCRNPSLFPGEPPAPHHELMVAKLEEIERGELKRLMVLMPPGHGKQIAHDTPVFTPEGWKKHCDLRVGDFVFHPSGRTIMVVATGPESEQDCEVEFYDGAVIRCHENHEWTLYDRSRAAWRTVETKYLESQSLISGDRARFQLPEIDGRQTPDRELPIDPYTLGVWLGDGRSSSPTIGATPEDMAYMVGRIPYAMGANWTQDTGVLYQYVRGGFSKLLRKCGLIDNKHIPAEYFTASETQRLELLAGLVDTDGSVDDRQRVRFRSGSKRLSDDVAALARTLGYRVSIDYTEPDERPREIKGGGSWCVQWTAHDGKGGGFLPRKVVTRIRERRRIGVKAVRRVAKEIGRCIQVDSPDGLYCVGEHHTPTHNSVYCSVRFPSWYLGRHPEQLLIHATYGGDLAQLNGRKVRNLIDSREYKQVFPAVSIAEDMKGRGDWATNRGGGLYAVGVGGGVTGRRGNGALLDDLVKDRAEADSTTIRDKTWDWYKTALRTRLRKNGWIVFVNTRWHEDDPAGRMLPANWSGESGWVTARDGEQWYVIRLPAIAEADDQLGREIGEPLWPEEKSLAALEQERKILGTRDWNALYQQYPTTEEGAILKAGYWRKWPHKTPPVVEYIVQSIDTAFEEDEANDYSARTTWGVFDVFNVENAKVQQAILAGKKRHEVQRYHAILLEAWRGKVPFSTLKRTALDGFKEYEPDRLLIEKKASGHSLIQELRRGGLPVKPVNPDKSKVSRAYAAEIPFEQGCVWHMDRDWVQPVIRECAQFPNGEHDDWVDTVTQALIWLRRTYHLEFKDEMDETPKLPRKVVPIYG